MTPKTRLDKVVQVRERTEDDALLGLARARVSVDRARERLARAVAVTQQDERAAGPAELWLVDDLARRRALQTVRVARTEVQQAVGVESGAKEGWTAAHRDTEVVRRAQERRRAEILVESERHDRRQLDELATLRFNAGR